MPYDTGGSKLVFCDNLEGSNARKGGGGCREVLVPEGGDICLPMAPVEVCRNQHNIVKEIIFHLKINHLENILKSTVM